MKFPVRLTFYLLIFGVVAASERSFGRTLTCNCGSFRPWISDVWSNHNSQHLFDPYSFSHMLHGVIFCWLLSRLGLHRSLCLVCGFFIEGIWEVIENSPLVIERYRAVTMAQGYSGDSILNSLGDLLSCLLGLELARLLGGFRSLLLFLAVEISMLLLIRDCLTFNVIMLLWPVDWIRNWQMSSYFDVLKPAAAQTPLFEASSFIAGEYGGERRAVQPSLQALAASVANSAVRFGDKVTS